MRAPKQRGRSQQTAASLDHLIGLVGRKRDNQFAVRDRQRTRPSSTTAALTLSLRQLLGDNYDDRQN
jgi:hypothetical protein